MADETIICTECGKEMPGTARLCPECGAPRSSSSGSRRPGKPRTQPGDVTAVTDAVRSVPKAPVERRPYSGGSRRRRHASRHSDRRSSTASLEQARRGSSGRRRSMPPEMQGVETDEDGRPILRHLARRKVYHYGDSKRRTFAYWPEIRAILLFVAIGLLVVLMCRMEEAGKHAFSGGQSPQASLGPGNFASARVLSPKGVEIVSPTRAIATIATREEPSCDQVHQLLVVSGVDDRGAAPPSCQGPGIPGRRADA
ncbi:zinc ribbon domain-containing protein [bacterium]|nr:zinc ribbon domain-containing protein [bacterium]